MAATNGRKHRRNPCALRSACACERAGSIAPECMDGILHPFGRNGDRGDVYHGLPCKFDALHVLHRNADGTRFRRGPRPISTGEMLKRARARNYNLRKRCAAPACNTIISNSATHCHKHAQGGGRGKLRFYAAGRKRA